MLLQKRKMEWVAFFGGWRGDSWGWSWRQRIFSV